MKLKNDRRFATPFGDFQVDVENLVDHLFGDRAEKCSSTCQTRDSANSGFSPAVSITESDQGYQLEMELPGVSHEDVEIEMIDSILSVAGEKKIDEPAEGVKKVRNERRAGTFSRKFEFSTSVDSDGIEASFDSGLLVVSVPKSEKVLPRKIEIKKS